MSVFTASQSTAYCANHAERLITILQNDFMFAMRTEEGNEVEYE